MNSNLKFDTNLFQDFLDEFTFWVDKLMNFGHCFKNTRLLPQKYLKIILKDIRSKTLKIINHNIIYHNYHFIVDTF